MVITACVTSSSSTPDFYRVRIGVGHPGNRDQVVPYVLGRPSKADRELIESSINKMLEEVPALLRGEYEPLMHRLHSNR